MGDFGVQAQGIGGISVSTLAPEGVGPYILNAGGNAAGSNTYVGANRAVYVPFIVEQPRLVVKLWSCNGTTASGNIDVGLYDVSGNRLVSSGSTAHTGTSVFQEYDITDMWLLPGTYYHAVSMDGTAGHIFRCNLNGIFCTTAGVLNQASAFPLPATWTPIAATSAYIPVIGHTSRVLI